MRVIADRRTVFAARLGTTIPVRGTAVAHRRRAAGGDDLNRAPNHRRILGVRSRGAGKDTDQVMTNPDDLVESLHPPDRHVKEG